MKSAAAAGPGPGVVHVGQRLTMRFESDVRFISLFSITLYLLPFTFGLDFRCEDNRLYLQ